MTIGIRFAPAPVAHATDATVNFGGSAVAGDKIVAVVISKRSASPSPTPSFTSGYTQELTRENGLAGYGIDTGSVRLTVFTKTAAGGETSVTASQTSATGSVIACWAVVVSKTLANWQALGFHDVGTNTSFTVSKDVGPSSFEVSAGHLVLFAGGSYSDSPASSGASVTATGATFGTTVHDSLSSSIGHDLLIMGSYAFVNSGASSGGVTGTWTRASSNNQSAATVMVKLAEVPVIAPVLGMPSSTASVPGKLIIPPWLKQPSSANTALPLQPVKRPALGIPTSIASVLPIDASPTHRPVLGLPSSANAVIGPVSNTKRPALSLVTELDAPHPLQPRKVPTLGQPATASSIIAPLARRKIPNLGQPTTTNVVQALQPRKRPPIGSMPSSAGTALPLQPRKIPNLGQPVSGNTNLGFVSTIEPIIEQALEAMAVPIVFGEDPNVVPAQARAAILAETTHRLRRVDIYEADGVTPWKLDAPLLTGSVSIDGTRDERRMCDLEFANHDGAMDNYPDGFWYDKIVKVFMGVQWEGLSPSSLYFDGVHNAYLTTKDSPRLTLRSSLMLSACIAPEAWVSGTYQTLGCKWDEVLGYSYWFGIKPDGRLALRVSRFGSDTIELSSTAVVGGVNRKQAIVSVAYTANNGAAQGQAAFAASLDGTSTKQLGSATTVGATGIYDSPSPFTIGAHDTAALEPFKGDMYWFEVKRSQTGDQVLRLDFTETPATNESFLDRVNNFLFRKGGEGVLVRGGKIENKSWMKQVGEFRADGISSPNFPHVTKASFRDMTAKLLDDGFDVPTSFAKTALIETVVEAVARNGGITKFNIESTGQALGKDMTFDADTPRWEVIKKIADAANCEVYFDNIGRLTMRKRRDPSTSPKAFTFQTGADGNLASYTKSSSQSEIKNVVVVVSEASDTPTVVSRKENTNPASPTNITRLGRRVYRYKTEVPMTQAQADALASSLLAVMSLESWEVQMEAIVLPWLEANEIIEFNDPNPNPGEPSMFLMSNLTLPLGMGTMSVNTKRLTVVS